MQTERVVLLLGQADGAIREVPMRYNGSHQRGYRCFIGELADSPDNITEDTPRSFEGRRLFDALAEYRGTFEPQGWRLLHAIARRDCWPKPAELFPIVQRLTAGVEQTQTVNAFEPADFADVTTLEEQSRAFQEWKRSLPPAHEGRVPPRASHRHDEASVEFGPFSRFAGRVLSQRDD